MKKWWLDTEIFPFVISIFIRENCMFVDSASFPNQGKNREFELRGNARGEFRVHIQRQVTLTSLHFCQQTTTATIKLNHN